MEKEGDASAAQEILDGLNVDVNRLLPVPEKAFAKAWIQGNDSYLQMYRESMEDTVGFWDKVRKKRRSEFGRTRRGEEGGKEAKKSKPRNEHDSSASVGGRSDMEEKDGRKKAIGRGIRGRWRKRLRW